MPYGRKTGGRVSGTPNKVNGHLRGECERVAGMPLPVLLVEIALKALERGDHHLAVVAVARACSYVYPRPTDTDGPTLPRVVIVDDIAPITDGPPTVVVRLPTLEKNEATERK